MDVFKRVERFFDDITCSGFYATPPMSPKTAPTRIPFRPTGDPSTMTEYLDNKHNAKVLINYSIKKNPELTPEERNKSFQDDPNISQATKDRIAKGLIGECPKPPPAPSITPPPVPGLYQLSGTIHQIWSDHFTMFRNGQNVMVGNVRITSYNRGYYITINDCLFVGNEQMTLVNSGGSIENVPTYWCISNYKMGQNPYRDTTAFVV